MADAFAFVLWLKTDGTGSFVLHHGNDDRMRAFRVEESKCSISWKESTAYKNDLDLLPKEIDGFCRNKQFIHMSSLKARSSIALILQE